ncbi:MAG: response regulator [Gammaproteobacteria bacterium]|jgi:twitching motility two-component system response regulator PilH|nr:response regulator [Gammaproteobacteria bacterium]
MSQLDRFRRLLGMRQPDDRRARRRLHARRGLRVLIVDDSRTIVAALSHMLGQNGYDTSSAEDAESALKSAFEDPPDLIFLDIVLPGMTGFSALRKLRRHPGTESVPVIMISGNPQAVEEFYLKKIGADAFMKKPFGRFEVFSCIERLVSAGDLPARGSAAEAPTAED